jgi:hypothetical protein
LNRGLEPLVSISRRRSLSPFSPARCHLLAPTALPEQMALQQKMFGVIGGLVLTLDPQASNTGGNRWARIRPRRVFFCDSTARSKMLRCEGFTESSEAKPFRLVGMSLFISCVLSKYLVSMVTRFNSANTMTGRLWSPSPCAKFVPRWRLYPRPCLWFGYPHTSTS